MRKKSNQRCHLYYILLFISSLLLLRSKPTNSQNQSCNSGDLGSLRSLYDGLESKAVLDWRFNDSSTSDCCNWVGVRCDSLNYRVSGIFLSNKSLKGFLYNSFTGFDKLKSIDLSYNSFYGTVPASLFQLPQLESLNLSLNSFSGAIPATLNLPSIQVFNISFNQFNGSLPILPGSRNLREFDVAGNSFYGNITSSMCIYSGMVQVLRFSMNRLFGDFPIGYGNCTGLTELSLDMNGLTGTLPDDLFNLSNLTKLNLQGNSLTGTLNPKFGNLANLIEIDLSANNFTGTIPDVFDKLKKLETLCASSNTFNSLLPLSLSNCSALKVLSLRNNSLIGDINLNFSSLSRLNTLDLGTNHFNGKIPFNLPECKQMKTLNLARNNLVGEIPSSFVNFTSISYLSLTGNKFSNLARALQILQNLPNLTILVLTKNFHGGETMPSDGINGFLNIEVFVMANCALQGFIPPWFANLNKLNVLDISWNQLTGTVPPWLGNFDHLFYLDISNNSLTGEIPATLTHMKSLMLSNNSAKQRASIEELPFFVRRNLTGKPLQYNQVSSFPPSLILSHNKLVGSISPDFSDLRGLLVLDLSYNNLTGTIPNNLSGMSSLETLDLSHNDLNGTIPASLTKLNFLSKFDVAYNNLTGEIPTGGQFSAFPPDYFEGNPGLCGSHYNQCDQVNDTSKLHSTKNYKNKGVIIGPVIGIGIGVVAFLALFFLVSRIKSRVQERNSKAVANAEDSSSENGASKLVLLFQNKDASKELTIEDILKSTNNFDQGLIVGCGGFGLVYKGTLPGGKRVAIKRLSGDFCQIEREFQAEVETLSRVQHENLVLLEGYCKIGSDRLLIYSFMENGSLDYWLHEKPDGPGLLDWSKRLHIARGSARGLCYLHQSCDPHILHRDIKSSNILLDGSFNAHLADFGLARLILPYDTHVTTDVVGTLGYIPPEYGQSPLATFKGDVYSFGVVLLELITGRRPVDMCRPRGSRDVVSWVVQMKAEGRKEEVFDEIITSDRGNLGSFEQAGKVLEIACLCVAVSPKSRPLAYQLVAWLDEIGADGK
ncbi:phytosulfokine receptor 1-like protein [Carex littledalei]|uniref:non-specific serine/threonine protein kinase n=1 Tax=Carex littledalei TaxID=544730 RepID=A0A833QE68_9POAL|nr:phytosulfokine receptor 1-like protein [Carex littledalei]